MFDAERANEIYKKLATKSFEERDYQKCLEFAYKVSPPYPSEFKKLISIASYELGKKLAANQQIHKAQNYFRKSLHNTDKLSLRRLCESRLNLLAEIHLVDRLSSNNCPICTKNPCIRPPKKLDIFSLRPEVDEIYCIGAYRHGFDPDRGNPFSVLIRAIKRPKKKIFLSEAGKFLAHFVSQHLSISVREKVDLIVPVPTVPSRYVHRGYSIPEELARAVSKQTSIPYFADIVQMTKETSDLRYLSKSERKKELCGVFEVTLPDLVNGYSIIVIDDVVTHGTTQKEIGKILHNYGAKEVIGVVMAHTESSDGSS